MEFLSRYDLGLVSKKETSDSLKNEGMVRDESEIKEMIKNFNPAQITKSILFSKKDFVSQFKVLKSPEPKMGVPVEEMGLDESVTEHLTKSGI